MFLSPEEELSSKKSPVKDQGASPVLRRSNRKRKSTAPVSDMTKGSSNKKKRNSPAKQESDPGRSMPRIPRTPQATEPEREGSLGQGFEALLLAMEGRLTAKLERASDASRQAAEQAKLNSES